MIVDADDVDPGDMGPDVVRRAMALHFRPVARIAEHEVLGHDSGADDLLRAIDVGEEHVQRLDALDQSRFQPQPFVMAEQARDDVERDQALGGLLVAIDGEGDADAAKQHFRLLAPGIEQPRRGRLEPFGDAVVQGARRSVAFGHLVETGHAHRLDRLLKHHFWPFAPLARARLRIHP